MNPTQKTLTIVLWALTVVAMLSFAASGMLRPRQDHSDRVLENDARDQRREVPSFSLIDQEGRAFTNDDVAGRPWIADFIFTRCAEQCPAMTVHMVDLQKNLADADVRLVSVSVDPTYDTPSILKEYGKVRGADFSKWSFVTGDRRSVFDLATHGLLLPTRTADDPSAIIHSEKFVLIDGQGVIRQWYNSKDPEQLVKLEHDARTLAAARH